MSRIDPNLDTAILTLPGSDLRVAFLAWSDAKLAKNPGLEWARGAAEAFARDAKVGVTRKVWRSKLQTYPKGTRVLYAPMVVLGVREPGEYEVWAMTSILQSVMSEADVVPVAS